MAGVFAALAAAVIWGIAPILYAEIAYVPPGEVLAHRTLWAGVFVGVFCVFTGRLARVRATLADRRERRLLLLTTALIAFNWFLFIFAVQAGRLAEAGIGYYIMPLVGVALGVLVLGERLTRAQWTAVGIACAGVVLLTVGTGTVPWLAFGLAVSFALYGLIRKQMQAGPISGFLIEAAMFAPFGLAWLAGAHLAGWSAVEAREAGFFGRDLWTSALLVVSGPVTGLPLILFAEAARRLPYSAAGLILYLNPTLQVIVASAILGEKLTIWHAPALALIWIALGLYSWSGYRRERARSRAEIASGTRSTTVR